MLNGIMARKTEAQRRRERAETRDAAQREYWPKFKARVEAVTDYHVAREVAEADIPPPDTPNRLFHTSLMFFLSSLRVPGQASQKELALYSGLMDRIAHQLKEGVAEKVKAELAAAIQERRDVGED